MTLELRITMMLRSAFGGWLADVHLASDGIRRDQWWRLHWCGRVIFDMGHDVGEVDIDNVSLVAGHVGTAESC